MDNNTVENIDCLIGMQNIPDKSIDMILCDLPYGTTACKWDITIPFASLWKQYERIIKDNGAIVLTASQPFTSMLVMSKLPLFKYSLVWEKSHSTGHLNSKRMPLRKHEDIVVFCKGISKYFPILKPKAKETQRPCGAYTNIGDGSKVYGTFRKERGIVSFIDYPQSILKFNNCPTTQRGLHPTQKPVALFEYLIKTYTNEGETILDNCAGSGTTAIACINTNRKYILMEKEEKYYNIIQERIKRHTVQLKPIA